MPTTISRDDVLTVIDLLQEKKFVHIFCRMDDHLSSISDIVVWYIKSHEAWDLVGRYDWRAFVVSDPFVRAVRVIEGVKRRTKVAGFTHWDAAIKGRYGVARALIANPISLQGIRGDNLFFVLLRNHNEDVWNALWPAIGNDTRILAVNCELFSEKSDFAYVDWGE